MQLPSGIFRALDILSRDIFLFGSQDQQFLTKCRTEASTMDSSQDKTYGQMLERSVTIAKYMKN